MTISSLSQTNPAGNPLSPTPKNQINWGHQVIISDKNGQPFKPGYDDVVGSPFYFDDWMNALVAASVVNDSGVIKLKFDLVDDNLVYLDSKNQVLVIQKGFINSFSFLDSAGTIISVFRSGFPAIDKQTQNHYYQVLVDGKVQLLKLITKKIIEQKNDVTGESKKEFASYESFYVYKDGVLKSFKKDKEFVLFLFSDQQEKINSYLASKKLNFRSLDDVTGLFKFYNSLFKGF
jgi:hypothetical protein